MPLHVSRAMPTARRMSGMYAPAVLRLSQRCEIDTRPQPTMSLMV